jgi:hypothetical protein
MMLAHDGSMACHLGINKTYDKPFSRVLVDCVGPLPKAKSGHQYLLTIMCAATRFPEAIPLSYDGYYNPVEIKHVHGKDILVVDLSFQVWELNMFCV